jgi:beta-glucanase (GH16 family)
MATLVCARADAASSGQPMPVGDLDSFKQVFHDDFSTNASIGNFPGSAYASTWDTYDDGLWDTFKVAKQYPSRVLSVSNSNLTWNFRTADGYPMVASTIPRTMGPRASPYDTFAYGRYSVRVRSSSLAAGYMPIFLLWPDSENWPGDGEIDYPGGDLTGTIFGSLIRAQTPIYHDHALTGLRWDTWHTATIDWRPGILTFYMDGRAIGTFTQGVPTKSMHWVLQVDSSDNNPAASPTATGNLEVDWVSVWRYDPSTVATTLPPAGEPRTGSDSTVLHAPRSRRACRGKAKAVTAKGLLTIKFPSKTSKRRAKIVGTGATNFRNTDTSQIGNGTYRLLTRYVKHHKGKKRVVHGCRRLSIAN